MPVKKRKKARVPKRTSKVVSKKSSPVKRAVPVVKSREFSPDRRKFNLVIRNLMVFFALFLISLLLSYTLSGEMMQWLFGFLTIAFLALSILFLVIFFILLVLRLMKR